MPTLRQIPIDRACAMLSAIREFHDLSASDLEEIARQCSWYRYEENEEIVHFQDKSNSVFFIAQGDIRVTYHALSGHEVILCDLTTGEMFGELTAIDGKSRSASPYPRIFFSALIVGLRSRRETVVMFI